MSDLMGFYSYVHADDENDLGRVTDLGRDIVGELKAITGDDDLELFLDRDGLHQGDQWRDTVDETLSNVAFFIPIITPRFFRSVECRRELQFFADKAEMLGISEIILPILYIDFSEIHDKDSTDPLIQMIQRVHWEPWFDIRPEGRASSNYRKGVGRLARELNLRRKTVESKDIIPAAKQFDEQMSSKIEAHTKFVAKQLEQSQGDSIEETEFEGAGTLELLGAMEEASPRLTEAIEGMSAEIGIYSEIIGKGTTDFQKGNEEGKGFAWRLLIARRMATEIEGPVNRIEELGRNYLSELHQIDVGFRVLLPRIVEEARDDPSTLPSVRAYLRAVSGMYEVSKGSKESILAMVESFKPLEKMSKDLRAPLRKMRTTLISMSEAQAVMEEWMAMIEDTGIDFSDPDEKDS